MPHARLLILAWLPVIACVGDDPVGAGDDSPSPDGGTGGASSSSSSGGSSSGSSSSGGGSSSSSGQSDAAVDAPSCTAPEVDCQGTCVDLGSSPTSCGRCGHDCGGGACVEGVCQVMVVRDALDHPVFDIDATNVYFSQDSRILSCPLPGCGSTAPRQVGALAANVHGSGSGFLRVGGGNLFFMVDATSGTSGPNLVVCPTGAGCSAPPPVIGSAGHQSFGGGFAAAGAEFYWTWYKDIRHVTCSTPGTCVDDESYYRGTQYAEAPLTADGSYVYFLGFGTTTVLQRCPAVGPCVPATVGTMQKAITALQVQDNKVWVLSTGDDGYVNGSIRTCRGNVSDCTGEQFAANLPFPTAFTVDPNAVSWLNRDPAGGLPASSIVSCPLGGCNGGPRTLAAAQPGARALRSDDGFVYWSNDTQILRVAK